MNGETVLQTRGLRKKYANIEAVKDLDIMVPKGSVFGLLGPNGSGKTTTLGMVLGVIHPTSGSFSWMGQPLDFQTKRKIGAILETPNFYPYLSGAANLEIVADIKRLKKPRIGNVLDQVNLRQRGNSKFKTYSLGMKQRLAIASALLCEPEVLVLDEPTNGLDPQGIAEIRSLIKRIAEEGITIILASHLLDEVEKVCTHAAVLRHGNLLFNGTVNELTGADVSLEVGAQNYPDLDKILLQHPSVLSVEKIDDNFLVNFKKTIKPSEINQFLAEKEIFSDHYVLRKNSLEKQFLKLIEE